MKLVFSSNELEYMSGTDDWVRLVDGFLSNLKLLLVSEIHQVYKIPRQVASDLVRIRNYDYTSFEVGIIDSKSYSRSHKRIILKVLRYEYGSSTNAIESLPVIRALIDSLETNMKYLWYDYVLTEVLHSEI